MANVLNLLSEETFAEKLDTQNTLLAALVSQGGGLSITSPSDIQSIVRLGLASKIFTIGDQIACQKGSTTLIWDIIGIDHDIPSDKNLKHSLTLQLHDCLAGMQFDSREALFYAEKKISAGTYNFTVTQYSGESTNVGETFQFTLTKDVPVGGQIVLMTPYTVAIAGSTVKTYSVPSESTEIETATVKKGSAGISLGDVNNAINGNTNSLQRGLLGSNNYAESAIRQYLNSKAAAGNVWTPQTKFDRPPSWAATTAGFLSDIDEDFLAVIGEVDKITALNTVSDGGGTVTTSEKFFLLSRYEIYSGNENSAYKGVAYPYYSENSDLSMAGTGADSNRIKYSNNAAQFWWLRSPNTIHAYSVRVVSPVGAISIRDYYATSSYGVAPACCII